MKIKTSELTCAALDWAVAKALGYADDEISGECKYSTDWAQGGEIIDKEGITVGVYHNEDGNTIPNKWQAYIGWKPDLLEPAFQADGPTAMIAAMRAIVSSKLGDEVEVPEELTK